ncbi:hypothetical protein KFK09_026835 [Dendrobium nobile]|uniref:Uncharacterized protein n=1 Tax=Dendrobium nobile TaxID=94219 RepID=A0A8T3A9T7_DENNO|nr:hypothetical protein KFK09_026835 [Dendrobium nobile]
MYNRIEKMSLLLLFFLKIRLNVQQDPPLCISNSKRLLICKSLLVDDLNGVHRQVEFVIIVIMEAAEIYTAIRGKILKSLGARRPASCYLMAAKAASEERSGFEEQSGLRKSVGTCHGNREEEDQLRAWKVARNVLGFANIMGVKSPSSFLN